MPAESKPSNVAKWTGIFTDVAKLLAALATFVIVADIVVKSVIMARTPTIMFGDVSVEPQAHIDASTVVRDRLFESMSRVAVDTSLAGDVYELQHDSGSIGKVLIPFTKIEERLLVSTVRDILGHPVVQVSASVSAHGRDSLIVSVYVDDRSVGSVTLPRDLRDAEYDAIAHRIFSLVDPNTLGAHLLVSHLDDSSSSIIQGYIDELSRADARPALMFNLEGALKFHANDWTAAMGDFASALRSDARYLPARFNYALTLYQKGDPAALDSATALRVSAPDRNSVQLLWAKVAWFTSDRPEIQHQAIEVAKQTLRSHPLNHDGNVLVGYDSYFHSRFLAAADDLQRIRETEMTAGDERVLICSLYLQPDSSRAVQRAAFAKQRFPQERGLDLVADSILAHKPAACPARRG